MHRCLLVEDLMHLVCEEIDRGDGGGLHSFALTAKALLGPSLSVIWREQHSLYPLFSVLPSDLWDQYSSDEEWDDDDGSLVFKSSAVYLITRI